MDAKVEIHSDSTVALGLVESPSCKSGLATILTIRQNLSDAMKKWTGVSIRMCWSPSHAGIVGNERADSLAAEATQLQLDEQALPVPSCRFLRTTADLVLAQEWTSRYRVFCGVHRHSPAVTFVKGPPSKHCPKLLATDVLRQVLARYIQVVLGHGAWGEYFLRMFLAENITVETDCDCGERIESRTHRLLSCTNTRCHRDNAWSNSDSDKGTPTQIDEWTSRAGRQ
jgi:hypothetical protein